jgi:hypothetical protein
MANMILESRVTSDNVNIMDNSYKRRAITELNENVAETGFEEYPTMQNRTFSREQLAERMGYGNSFSNVGINDPDLITVSSMNPEGDIGSGRPIDPRTISPELIQAFNRDYRPLMKALNKNNG